jgi:hypothetical protein
MKQYVVLKRETAKRLKELTGINLMDLNYIFDSYYKLVKQAIKDGKAVSFGDIATIRPLLRYHNKYSKSEKKVIVKNVKRLKINIKDKFRKELDRLGEEVLSIKPRDIV